MKIRCTGESTSAETCEVFHVNGYRFCMTSSTTIYVKLVGEDLDVWKPVQAEHLTERRYRVSKSEASNSIDHLEFKPGTIVICEEFMKNGKQVLKAVSSE